MQPMGPDEVKAQAPQRKLTETLGVSAPVLAPKVTCCHSHLASLHLLPIPLYHRNRFLIQQSICLLSCSALRSRQAQSSASQGPHSTHMEGWRQTQFTYCAERGTMTNTACTCLFCSGQGKVKKRRKYGLICKE